MHESFQYKSQIEYLNCSHLQVFETVFFYICRVFFLPCVKYKIRATFQRAILSQNNNLHMGCRKCTKNIMNYICIILYVIRIQCSRFSTSSFVEYMNGIIRCIFIVKSSADYMWISIIYNKCENISCFFTERK